MNGLDNSDIGGGSMDWLDILNHLDVRYGYFTVRYGHLVEWPFCMVGCDPSNVWTMDMLLECGS